MGAGLRTRGRRVRFMAEYERWLLWMPVEATVYAADPATPGRVIGASTRDCRARHHATFVRLGVDVVVR